jgi:hypothetical protein
VEIMVINSFPPTVTPSSTTPSNTSTPTPTITPTPTSTESVRTLFMFIPNLPTP